MHKKQMSVANGIQAMMLFFLRYHLTATSLPYERGVLRSSVCALAHWWLHMKGRAVLEV